MERDCDGIPFAPNLISFGMPILALPPFDMPIPTSSLFDMPIWTSFLFDIPFMWGRPQTTTKLGTQWIA